MTAMQQQIRRPLAIGLIAALLLCLFASCAALSLNLPASADTPLAHHHSGSDDDTGQQTCSGDAAQCHAQSQAPAAAFQLSTQFFPLLWAMGLPLFLLALLRPQRLPRDAGFLERRKLTPSFPRLHLTQGVLLN